MSKLSILKWVYDLGYKKAEEKYYFALLNYADNLPPDFIPIDPKLKKEDDDRYRTRRADLKGAINGVFKPEKTLPLQEYKDRFLP